MPKIIIAGGRDFNNYELLEKSFVDYIDENYWIIHGDYFTDHVGENEYLIPNDDAVVIVSGKANGADKLGEKLAAQYNLTVKEFPADWDGIGKSAGYVRNAEMANYADGLLAFWDGKSKGTKHMIDLAKRKGLVVKVVSY